MKVNKIKVKILSISNDIWRSCDIKIVDGMLYMEKRRFLWFFGKKWVDAIILNSISAVENLDERIIQVHTGNKTYLFRMIRNKSKFKKLLLYLKDQAEDNRMIENLINSRRSNNAYELLHTTSLSNGYDSKVTAESPKINLCVSPVMDAPIGCPDETFAQIDSQIRADNQDMEHTKIEKNPTESRTTDDGILKIIKNYQKAKVSVIVKSSSSIESTVENDMLSSDAEVEADDSSKTDTKAVDDNNNVDANTNMNANIIITPNEPLKLPKEESKVIFNVPLVTYNGPEKKPISPIQNTTPLALKLKSLNRGSAITKEIIDTNKSYVLSEVKSRLKKVTYTNSILQNDTLFRKELPDFARIKLKKFTPVTNEQDNMGNVNIKRQIYETIID